MQLQKVIMSSLYPLTGVYHLGILLALLFAREAWANTPIGTMDFMNNLGLAAAQAAAPMWYFPSGMQTLKLVLS